MNSSKYLITKWFSLTSSEIEIFIIYRISIFRALFYFGLISLFKFKYNSQNSMLGNFASKDFFFFLRKSFLNFFLFFFSLVQSFFSLPNVTCFPKAACIKASYSSSDEFRKQ